MITIAIIVVIALNSYINLRKSFVDISASTTIVIDLYLKHVILNEITIYEKSDVVKSLTQLFEEYENLFID